MANDTLKYVIQNVQQLQRESSRSASTKEVKQRIEHLKQLKKMLSENEVHWLQALNEDLGKPTIEAYASEIGILLNEIDFVTSRLAKWMKPVIKRRYLLSGLEKTTIVREPYGSVLVLSPWNYPLQLALSPVIGAIAGGNGTVLKPSESAAAVSQLLSELVPQYFEKEVLYVIEGDGEVAQTLTDLKWDFIFFTGGPAIGQDVYQKAAQHLTPVVLELGGKNPCIVDESALNDETIKKIIWGKFLNVGQTCIAPDTIYVKRQLYPDFLDAAKKQIADFYSEEPVKSGDYGRIIHTKHLDKMIEFLNDGEVIYGGTIDRENLYIAPTLMTNVTVGSALDEEEIFGPILPVVPYDEIEEVLHHYQNLPVPLVTYLFTEKQEQIQFIKDHLESGALSVNEVLVHASSPHVPFGGKGQSGLGNYRGKASYETFTYERTLFQKQTLINLPQQFPPYGNKALEALRRFRRRIY
jgi:aldehyde dehydrogenase (NAD+)